MKPFKSFYEEFTFKVDVEGLPDMFMKGNSPGAVKAHLRKLVKQPSMIKSVDRMTKHDVKKTYRDKAQGKEVAEAVDSTDTGGEEEVNMAIRQVKAMKHFLDGIEARVKKTGDMEEWYQNKLTKANDYLKTLYSYGKGDGDDATSEGTMGQIDYASDKSVKIMKKKTPGEDVNELSFDKMNRYHRDAQRSKDRATNSAVANILRKGDHSKDLQTRNKRMKGMALAKSRTLKKIRGDK